LVDYRVNFISRHQLSPRVLDMGWIVTSLNLAHFNYAGKVCRLRLQLVTLGHDIGWGCVMPSVNSLKARRGSTAIEYVLVLGLLLLCGGMFLSALADTVGYANEPTDGSHDGMRRPVQQALR
jgi:hypothetical protein